MRALAAVLVLLLAHVAWAEQRLPAATPGSFAGSSANSSIISGQPGIIIMFESDAPDPCPDPCTHTLTWSTSNTAGATGSQDVGTDFDPTAPDTGTAISGTQDVTATADTVYTLSVPGLLSGPTKQATASVNVDAANPPPQVFNDSTANIHDTYDPLCDGTNPEITLCDGHEDAVWIGGAGLAYSSTSDYWGWLAQPAFVENDGQGGTNYAECNSSPNPNRADFGIAGTRCTATKGWVDAAQDVQNVGGLIDGFHCAAISGGNPNQCAPVSDHFSIRFGIKFAGVTSTRCTGAGAGDNPCAAYPWLQKGSNGHKGVVTCLNDSCGLGHTVELQTWFGNPTPTIGEYSQMIGVTPNESNTGWAGNSPDPDIYGSQKSTVDELDHRSFLDQWIWVEMEVHAVNTSGLVRVWMDACGRDGLGCTPGSQTLVIEKTGLDLEALDGNELRMIWMNWWNRGQTGEIQWDELVIKDRSCVGCDSNIDWMANVTLP